MKKTIALFLAFFLVCFPCLADFLVLQDGTKIKGTIMEQTPEAVTIRIIETGNELKVKRTDIAATVQGDFDKALVEKMINDTHNQIWLEIIAVGVISNIIMFFVIPNIRK
jgi:hypothetical protein